MPRHLKLQTYLLFGIAAVLLAASAKPARADGCATADFKVARSFDIGTNTGFPRIGLATADFNGDGAQDVVAPDLEGNAVAVFLNDGTGWFALTKFAVGSQPTAIAVGNFNADNDPDIVVTNAGSNNISILLGGAGGSFGPATNFAVGTGPRAVALGDFNGDGKVDIVVGNDEGRSVSVLLGNGAGVFSSAAGSPISLVGEVLALTVADFNSDAKSDLVVATSGGNQGESGYFLLIGNGAAGFSAPSQVFENTGVAASASDVNGDTKTDLILGHFGGVALLIGNGAGGFSAPTFLTLEGGGGGDALAVGDLDNDNKQDLAVASSSFGVTFFKGDGLGGFVRGKTYVAKSRPVGVALNDFNGDGLRDIATVGRAEVVTSLSIILNMGTGDFAAARAVSTVAATTFGFSTATDLAIADFNGDSRPDMAVSHQTFAGVQATIAILLNDGAGGFTPVSPITYFPGSSLRRVVTADFNKDGKADIAVAGTISVPFTHVVSVSLGNGDGSFAAPNNITGNNFASDSPFDLAVGDFNNDTNPDIVVVSASSQNFAILLGNGMGDFPLSPVQFLGTSFDRVAVGDFNNDSKQDFVITDLNDGRILVLQNNGNLTFSVIQTIDLPNTPSAVVVDDFNSDGKRDIAVAGRTFGGNPTFDEGSLSVLLGDGTGGFAAPVHHEISAGPDELLSKDLDGDGKVDLAVVDRTASLISVLSGEAAGAFSAAVTFDFAGGPWAIDVSDFDADGRPDLAVLPPFPQVVGILFGKAHISQPCLFADNASITEGNSGSTNVQVPIRLSAASSQVVRVNYIVRGFPATEGQDFTVGAGTVTFQPGETTKMVAVPVIGDIIDEPEESFSLHLSGPLNARISDDVSKLTILDNDLPPSISISNASVTEGNSVFNPNSADFTVTLSAPSSFTVSVDFTVASGTAVVFDDFDFAQGTVSFQPGVTSRTISVSARGDVTREPNETFFVNLSNAVDASIADGQGQGTIQNDDPLPAIAIFDATGFELTGSDSTMSVNIHLSNPSSQAITVNFATANDTARAGSDYVSRSGTVTFSPGETQKSTTITIKDDLVDEVHENFFINLSSPVNATIADGQASCQIFDNDGPTISINDVSLVEGQSGRTNATFTISLSAVSPESVAVVAATANGTAIGNAFPSDFLSFSNRFVNIPAGATSATLTVSINGDVMIEPDETFFVNLFLPQNGTIADGQGVGTIVNDDTTSVQFSTDSVTVNETTGIVQLTVTRVGSLAGVFVANFETFDGSAFQKMDYNSSLGELRFEPNETTKTITVFITDDAFVEDPEIFFVFLSGPNGALTNQPSLATITINSNDVAPGPNPIDTTDFFVRQHYRDFLNRDPDTAGFEFWKNEIDQCGADAQCREVRRLNVSAAFFLSIEFQETGYLAYRFYKSAFGDATSLNVPGTVPLIRLRDFLLDAQRIGRDVQVGVGDWPQKLELNKQAYALEFVQQGRFLFAYPTTMTADEFVTKLQQNVGGAISAGEKADLIAILGPTPSDPQKRSQVVRAVADDADLRQAEFNRAFVLMQYYGYLRRNPDDQPDANFEGWKFWLDKLNQFNGNFIQAEMVKAFISSIEYRERFGP
jgi:hypothetical protein